MHDLLITHSAHNLPEKLFMFRNRFFFYIFEFPFYFAWVICDMYAVKSRYDIVYPFFPRTVLLTSVNQVVYSHGIGSDFDVFLLFRQYFEFVMNWNWKWNNWKIAFHLLPPCQYCLLFLFWLENTHKLYRAC